MSGLLLLVLAGLSIYAIRASFIAGAGRVELPAALERALAHGPPAVLAALLGSVVVPAGPGSVDLTALAVAAVAIVASRRLGMLSTVAIGSVLLVLLAQV